MVELAPGSRVTVTNPNITVGTSAPGLVQGFALVQGTAGPAGAAGASDAAVTALVNNVSSTTRAAIDDRAVARTAPTKHAPALGLYFPEAEGGKTQTHIQAAIDAMTGNSSSGGGTLVLSEGTYTIASTVVIAKAGVRIEGTGGFTAQIYCDPALTGSAFKFAIANTFVRGSIVRNIVLRMNGATADGLVFEGAYDQTILDNVYVADNTGNTSAFKFIPATGAPSAISQTILANNCAAWAAVGHTGNVWHLKKVQEATFVGCKGLSGNEGGSGTSFYLEDCRGVSFYNCSAGKTGVAWKINTVSYAISGINIDNPTIEGATSTIVATGGSGRTIDRLSITNIRPQIGVALSAGPITLSYTTLSNIESQDLVVTLDANCANNHVTSEDLTKVTDSGTNNSVLAWRNANRLTTIHGGLAASASASTAIETRVAGRTGFHRQIWSASSVADNGYFQQYTPDGTTFRSAHFIEPDQIKQHWYVFDGTSVVESMRLERLPASAKSGFWLIVNNGTTTTLKQVEVGAADSAGSGFRTLRVAN